MSQQLLKNIKRTICIFKSSILSGYCLFNLFSYLSHPASLTCLAHYNNMSTSLFILWPFICLIFIILSLQSGFEWSDMLVLEEENWVLPYWPDFSENHLCIWKGRYTFHGGKDLSCIVFLSRYLGFRGPFLSHRKGNPSFKENTICLEKTFSQIKNLFHSKLLLLYCYCL